MVTTMSNMADGGTDESPPTVQSFMPTRDELVVLACHYMEALNATEFNCWVDGVKGTTDWRFIVFAERRLGSIHNTLGDDAFNAATDPIAEKWRAKYARAEECGVICERCGTLQDKQPNGFRVTGEDLEVLAEHYLAECWNETYSIRFYPAGCFDRNYTFDQRLRAIREALGDHAFERIQERVDGKWRRIFKYAKRALVCKVCSVPQDMLWRIKDGICGECRGVKKPRAEEHEESTSLTGSLGRD